MKILLVDDHALFRAGLRLLLSSIAPGAQVLEAATAPQATALAAAHPDPRLCLLDLSLKDGDGRDALHMLKTAAPAIGVVVVSAAEDAATVRGCIDAGAMGFIPKSVSPETLTFAILEVLAGRIYLPEDVLRASAATTAVAASSLTPRQLDVLGGLSRGLPTKLIARELQLSEYTVKEHIALLFEALGVHNRTEAVIKAGRLRLPALASRAAVDR